MIISSYIGARLGVLFFGEAIAIEKVKCPHCNQVLLWADYVFGEIKCPRCKKIIKLDIQPGRDRASSTDNK